jgi:hypothetical protein
MPSFFDHPIVNSPCDFPDRRWQPTKADFRFLCQAVGGSCWN